MGKQKNRNNKKKLKQASLTFRSGRQPTWPGPLGFCRLPHGGQSRQLGGEPWARRRRGLLLGLSPRTPECHAASTTFPAPLALALTLLSLAPADFREDPSAPESTGEPVRVQRQRRAPSPCLGSSSMS